MGGDDSILPVLIVGAGPVGLVLSILLTKLGVKCDILEKRKAFSTLPKAHIINNRCMEVFRKLDGLADDIVRSQPSIDCWRNFVYCTSLTGRILGSVDHMQHQDVDKIVSPMSIAHLTQYKLNRLLLNKLENLGFPKKLMGHKCISIKAADHGITVTASFENEGKCTKKDIHCNFLVGIDGAKSTIRKLVGIDMEGEKDLQNSVSIHFWSQDLGHYLIEERPGMLFFIFNPQVVCILVAHDIP